jgi:hypothetical protein
LNQDLPTVIFEYFSSKFQTITNWNISQLVQYGRIMKKQQNETFFKDLSYLSSQSEIWSGNPLKISGMIGMSGQHTTKVGLIQQIPRYQF